jgi:rod shape-determining protein MreC
MFKINTRKTFVIIAVMGLLIFLYSFGALNSIERMMTSLLNPIFSGFYSFSSNLRSKYEDQTSKLDLLEKVKSLEIQVSQLIEENAQLKIMEEENEKLREHLKFFTTNNYQYIMSNVISRGDISDIAKQTETIIIDKGIKDGIYTGLGVVSSQGTIVGKVAEVKDSIAKIYLTNNSKCKLAATIMNTEETSAITEGELGLTIKMKFIPQDRDINIGDIIVTSGMEQSIPRGLVIGRVIEVNKESNQIWQTATIEPVMDQDDFIIVSVLLP